METQIITKDLRTMGVGRQYLGYNITIQAVRMVVMNETNLHAIGERIYKPIALHLRCDQRTIERNIRTVIQRAWMINQPYMEQLAGYPLTQPPSITEFLEMLADHALRRFAA